MILILMVLSILMAIIASYILKDMTAPPVLLFLIWGIMYFILMISSYQYDSNNYMFAIFFISAMCFFYGFFFIINQKKYNKIKQKIKPKNLKKIYIYIFFFVEIIILFILLFGIIKFVQNNFERNIWFSLKYGRAMGTYYEGEIIERFRVVCNSVTHILAIVYFSNSNKMNKKYYFIQLILSSIICFFGVGRTTMFTLYVPILFIYIYIKKPNKKSICKSLIVMTILLLLIFIGYAYAKFPYLIGESHLRFILDQMQLYTVSPMIAFVEWLGGNNDYALGTYTFRFIIAIFSECGFNITPVNLASEYVVIGNDLTNVYTILHYYTKDFGIIYSLIIEFVLGMGTALVYNKMNYSKNNTKYIAIWALLFYPLIMQFFVDQYISLTSQWIQYILCYIVISKIIILNEKKEI